MPRILAWSPARFTVCPARNCAISLPPEGNLHRFRWDQALGFAQWLLKDEFPDDVTVYLVEGKSFELGDALTPPVQASIERIADAIMDQLAGAGGDIA